MFNYPMDSTALLRLTARHSQCLRTEQANRERRYASRSALLYKSFPQKAVDNYSAKVIDMARRQRSNKNAEVIIL